MCLLTSMSLPFWPMSCTLPFLVLCPALAPLSVLSCHLLVPLRPPCLPSGEALHPRCLSQCRAAAAGGPPAPYRHLHPPTLPGECAVSMVSGDLPSIPPHLWLWAAEAFCIELSPQNPGQWLQQHLRGICTESWHSEDAGNPRLLLSSSLG